MTSIEWLLSELEKVNYHPTEAMIMYANKLHKQEIIDAQSYAVSNADMTNNKGYFDCEQYYQETFVSKGSDKHKEKLKELYPDAFSILGEVLFREKSGFVDIVPKQETLYTEEQVRELISLIRTELVKN